VDRVILHCDCNSYYASVECIDHPEWRDVPMAVCGDPNSRHGIILAKNELAKKFGVQTAETIFSARRKCPNLLLVPPHHSKYQEYCEKINAIYCSYTDRVERFSVDESWLDVTGSLHLFGSGEEIADALRRRVREELGITISVGVSFNKTFAKLGSDYKKPDATTVISRENFRDIVWRLPVRDMMFVGRAAEETLKGAGISTIGDLANAPEERLVRLLGKAGASIHACANGLDDSPVRRFDDIEPVKSIGNAITFSRNLISENDIKTGLTLLCDSVGTRLRAQKLFCRTVQVQIKNPDLQVIQRQRKLPSATNNTKEIFDAALDIIRASWPIGAPIRLLGVTASTLTDHAEVQFDLFDDGKKYDRAAELDKTIDAIRSRFGKTAIGFGRTMGNDVYIRHEEE